MLRQPVDAGQRHRAFVRRIHSRGVLLARPSHPDPHHREQGGDDKQAVEGTEDDHEKHGPEEGPKHVARREAQWRHREDGRERPLHHRIPEFVQRIAHAFVAGVALCEREGVDDVRREVDAESGAHDDVDHGHGVEVNAPPGHVAYHADTGRHDAQRDEQTAGEWRHEHEGDGKHGGRCDEQVLARVRPHGDVLVVEDERRVEHRHVQVDVVVGDPTRRQHQVRFPLRRVDVLGEHEEPRLFDSARGSVDVDVVHVLLVSLQKCVQF